VVEEGRLLLDDVGEPPEQLEVHDAEELDPGVAGVAAPRLRQVPAWLVRAVGLFAPVIREFDEVRYQFERPFVLDSSRAKETFGLLPTDLDVVLASVRP